MSLLSPLLTRSGAFGAAAWFAGAIFVRETTKLGFFGPSITAKGPAPSPLSLLLPLLAAIPIGYVTILCLGAIGVAPQDRVAATACGTGVAVVLDGLALTLFPTLYNEKGHAEPLQLLRGAAFILFGGGVGLLCAFMA